MAGIALAQRSRGSPALLKKAPIPLPAAHLPALKNAHYSMKQFYYTEGIHGLSFYWLGEQQAVPGLIHQATRPVDPLTGPPKWPSAHDFYLSI